MCDNLMNLILSINPGKRIYSLLRPLLRSNSISDIESIYFLLTKKAKGIFRTFILCSIISGISDLSLVASLISLFELIGNSDLNQISISTQFYAYLSEVFGINNLSLTIWLGTAFASALSGILGLISFYKGAEFAAYATSDVGSRFFSSLINRDYDYYRNKNSTEVQSELAYLDILESQVLRSFAKIISGSIQMIIMSLGVLTLMPRVFIGVISILTIVYGLTIYISKSRLILLGTKKGESKQGLIRLANEITSNFKEIILRDMREEKLKKYDSKENKYRKTGLYIQLFSQSTRYIIESCILVSLCVFGAIANNNGQIINIGSIGGLVLAFRKIIPGVQQVYSSLVNIRSSSYIINRIINVVDFTSTKAISKSNFKSAKKTPISNNLLFGSDIEFSNLSLLINNKEQKKYLFKELNFKLKLGDSLFIAGNSGSGKSSLIDIMMGLVNPTTGNIGVLNDSGYRNLDIYNNIYWMDLISHVSQRIVLLDKTILDNITYGSLGPIDRKRLDLVCWAACFDKTIDSKREGLQYFVGEEGSNLSGGEKQRLGIARALYQNKPLLFLDEAMNALDSKTEIEITTRIIKLFTDRILICISHNMLMGKFYSKMINLSD